MKALRLFDTHRAVFVDAPEPAAAREGHVVLKMSHIALNHLDLFGYRGMAFARRTLPITVGVEGGGIVTEVGPGVSGGWRGRRAVIYPGVFCGGCGPCRGGQENLCEEPQGIYGFHLDGLAAEYVEVPARLLVEVPDDLAMEDAACAPITFATAHHMLFDNARLRAGESVLVHAAGSGIGSSAIRLSKAAGATVLTTVGANAKMVKARELGADVVVNYREESFLRAVRRHTGRKGAHVVFEHVGADTWEPSLLSLRKGGRLVICGSTTGRSAETNLLHLFNQQIRITASFGGTVASVRRCLGLMAKEGVRPVLDTVCALEDFTKGVDRLASRDVFGKIVLTM